MSATKEQLVERLADLKKQREQLVANANACAGAVQAVEAILADHFTDEPRIVPATDSDVEKVRQFPVKVS